MTTSGARWARIAAALAGLALVFAFYAWTAHNNATTFPTTNSYMGRDYFNLQTDAFLAGRASLLTPVAPELLALENPFDPSAGAFRAHDLSLFARRYYLYWGPTPVLALFLPARLVLGGELPERWAVILFSFAAFLVSLALLRFLIRRAAPDAPHWMFAVAAATLATSNVLPYLLRQPTVYQVAIAAGLFFMMLAVHLFVTGLLSERVRWWRLGAGSLCLGLATGARPSLGVTGIFAVVALLLAIRRERLRAWPERLRAAAVLLVPLGVCGVALLIYNYLRFESLTEFGLQYQLNDIDPYARGGLAGHLLPSLYFYVLAPAWINLNFPFFHLPPPPDYPGTLPPGYNREATQGLLPNVPIVVLGLAALPFAWRSAVPRIRESGRVMAMLAGMGLLLLASISVALYGVTMRYAVDYTTPFLLAALVGWVLLAHGARRRAVRRAVAVGGCVLMAYGALVGVAVSFTGATDGLRAGNLPLYVAIERAFSPLPTALARIGGRPIIDEAVGGAGPPASKVRYGTLGAGDDLRLQLGRSPAVLEIVSPGPRKAVLRMGVRTAPDTERLQLLVTPPGTERPLRYRVPDPALAVPLRLESGLNLVVLTGGGAGFDLPPGRTPAAPLFVDDVRLDAP